MLATQLIIPAAMKQLGWTFTVAEVLLCDTGLLLQLIHALWYCSNAGSDCVCLDGNLAVVSC